MDVLNIGISQTESPIRIISCGIE